MFFPLVAGLSMLAGKPFDFYSYGPYNSSVPRPESVLGYGPGERHTNFRDQERVLNAILASSPDRVKSIPYGVTPEGRPLRVFAISSPKNIARLDSMRAEHALLSQGKGQPSKTLPILWINECIHGDETASFEAGMWTFYNLVASRGPLAKSLDDEIVIFNPVYNPDGHERYVVYYNSIATGSSDPNAFEGFQPSVIYGRLNHYRFDMNRDRVAFSQDETRQEFAEMLKWGPQVYIDQHGQVGSYFFPPEPMSINPNVDRARNAKWTDTFGRATAKAFDANGFGYFVKDEFDLYYPGYLDASTTLSGAIGMTHETDGGRRLASQRDDGSVLTLRRGVEKHFLSALTIARATAENGPALLNDYAKFKKDATSGSFAGKFQRVVLTSLDKRPLVRLQTQLHFAGIESKFVEPFEQATAHDYWSEKVGSVRFQGNVLVVEMAQSQGPLAKALLEPGGVFEPEFIKAQNAKKKTAPDGENYPGPEGTEFYDSTGWALPYAHELSAWWCENAPPVTPVSPIEPRIRIGMADSAVGYALRYSDLEDAAAAFEALQAGVRSSVSTKPMNIGTETFGPGTFLFLADRNEEGYETKLRSIMAKRNVRFVPLTGGYPESDRNGLGSQSVESLKKPNVAVVMGTGTNLAEAGATWFLFERVFKLPFTPISGDALSRSNLNRFTAILLPSQAANSMPSQLRDWVNDGGHLVIFDMPKWAAGKDGLASLTESKAETQELPGSLFLAQMDPRSVLSFGYDRPSSGKIPIAVPISGSSFYEVKKEGGSVIAFSDDDKVKKLLTGWEWPDETEKALKNTAFLQKTQLGRGQVVMFSQDPTERAMWPGLYKLVLNAILFGRY